MRRFLVALVALLLATSLQFSSPQRASAHSPAYYCSTYMFYNGGNSRDWYIRTTAYLASGEMRLYQHDDYEQRLYFWWQWVYKHTYERYCPY